jgi:ribosomal protein S18 acetylase RimI-like enzyme
MPDVTLRPLTDEDRGAFFAEELANYADEQVRDAGWAPAEALGRARAELGPILERELVEADERGHRLWTAVGPARLAVGWLWVTPIEDESSKAAFLYQITVAERARRRGFGSAMLAALEELLAQDGIAELRLNVNVANEPARRLYAAAGYEEVAQDGGRCRLRKQLA